MINEILWSIILFLSGFVILSLLLLYKNKKEKNFILKIVQHYLSPTIIDYLIKHPDKLSLGGEKHFVTALTTDIAEFSTISNRVTSEKMVELLSDYNILKALFIDLKKFSIGNVK